jgi:hypothetical protein
MRRSLEKATKITVAPEPKAPVHGATLQAPRPGAMSLEKAKKLIRKTSVEHAELFRRLAK